MFIGIPSADPPDKGLARAIDKAASLRSEPQVSGVRRLVHVRELDGVRGIAALAVLFHHLCYTSVSTRDWGLGVRALARISHFGNAGVDLFFVLSGFLISSLLIEDRENRHYYHDFYWKRALRILPLYSICLLGVLVFYPQSGSYVLMSALFAANFAWVFHLDSSGPFWTLAIEEQFYLIWPTVVRRRSTSTISRWAIAVGMGAAVLRVLAACFGHHNYQFTFFHCDGLAMGAWLACRFERWDRLGLSHSEERRVWTVGLGFAGILIITSLHLPNSIQGEAFGAAALQSAITLLAGTLVAFVLVHRRRPYMAFFRSTLLTFCGLISYAMYMIHLYVMYAYDRFHGPMAIGDVRAYTLRLVMVIGVTIGLSLLSRYLVELPASSLRRFVVRQ